MLYKRNREVNSHRLTDKEEDAKIQNIRQEVVQGTVIDGSLYREIGRQTD